MDFAKPLPVSVVVISADSAAAALEIPPVPVELDGVSVTGGSDPLGNDVGPLTLVVGLPADEGGDEVLLSDPRG